MATRVNFPPVTNSEDWDDTTTITVDGEPYDLSGVTEITIKVRDPNDNSEELSATLDDGVTIVSEAGGVISHHFDAADMSQLTPQSYNVYCVIVDSGTTKQLYVGTVTVEYGGMADV